MALPRGSSFSEKVDNRGFNNRLPPDAIFVIDYFHVQKLALQALQEIRIKHRWEALDAEYDTMESARSRFLIYTGRRCPYTTGINENYLNVCIETIHRVKETTH